MNELRNDLEQHPLSAAFPAMSDEDFLALKDSIENIGVQNAITIYEEMVLDGWHRYRAATGLGVPCPTVQLDPDTDPRDFVLAQNKARRHVSAAQLAMATTKVYEWHSVGSNQHSSLDIECPPSKSNAELAAIAGVHPNTIKQAKAVTLRAVSEIQEAVSRGELGLPKALAISKLPRDQQVAALAKPMTNAERTAVFLKLPEEEMRAAMRELTPQQKVSIMKNIPRKLRDRILGFGSNDEIVKPQSGDEEGPSDAELAANADAEEADRNFMQKLLDADDKLAAAYAEVCRLNAEVSQLKVARDGFMNERNEAVKLVKSRDARIKHLERELSSMTGALT